MTYTHLLTHVSEIFGQQLQKALGTQLVIPVDTVANNSDIVRLRNGSYSRLWHCPLSEDHTAPKSTPLSIPLYGPLDPSRSWEELLQPASTYLAEQVVKKADGHPIVSAVLPVPMVEGQGAEVRTNSTDSLFSFRSILSADYNALTFWLTFDAIFGDVIPPRRNHSSQILA